MPHMSSPDELQKEVFLSCRTVFTGEQARIRRPGKIRAVLGQHRSTLGSLEVKYDWEQIADSARLLLQREVFESTQRAKREFPELFTQSASRGQQRTAATTQVKQAPTRAALVRVQGSGDVASGAAPGAIKTRHVAGTSTGTKSAPPVQSKRPSAAAPSTAAPSTAASSICLPYTSQHQALSQTQAVLERVCFDFATKWLPDILQKERWDCPEAVELSVWMRTLGANRARIPTHALNVSQGAGEATLGDTVLAKISKLRHTAVHRLPISATETIHFLEAATSFAALLNDSARAVSIAAVSNTVASHTRDREAHCALLQLRLERELRALSDQRAQLDGIETEARRAVCRDEAAHAASMESTLNTAMTRLLCDSVEIPEISECGDVRQGPGVPHGGLLSGSRAGDNVNIDSDGGFGTEDGEIWLELLKTVM